MVGLLLGGSAGWAGETSTQEPVVDVATLMEGGKPPRPIKQAPPIYPYDMRSAWLIGTVMLSMVIDQEGRVEDAYVIESNNPWFERPALDAVLGWRFTPGEMNGRRVKTRVTHWISFNLKSANPGEQPQEPWQLSKGKDHDKQPPELQWHTPPVPKMTLLPVYPYEQLQAGKAGKVRVLCVIGPDGTVLGAKLLEASQSEFGAAVMAMLDGWRFTPAAKKDGTACMARLTMEYEFRPNGRGDVPVGEATRGIIRLLAKTPDEITSAKDLDRPLKPRSQRPPIYPTAMKGTGQSGEAIVEFFVDQNGDAQLPRIVSSTAPEFGYAAVQAVATWRFEPPRKGGQPVVTKARIPLGFSLKKAPAPKPAHEARPEQTAMEILPKLVHPVTPEYPGEHLRDRVEGTATVRLTVEATGAVSNVHVVSESHPGFGAATVAAVKQWRFEPARKGGQPVACTFEREVRFSVTER